MADASHCILGLPPLLSVCGRQRPSQLIGRLEDRERDLLLLSPGVVITRPVFTEAAVERADEPRQRLADHELEPLAGGHVPQRERVPAEEEPVAARLTV